MRIPRQALVVLASLVVTLFVSLLSGPLVTAAFAAETWSLEKLMVASDVATGVSCGSSSSCFAVGYVRNITFEDALAEDWDGLHNGLFVPSPETATEISLSGVSCVSSEVCEAVGSQNDPGKSGPQPLAERLSGGSTWSVQAVPLPAGGVGGSLRGVSCTSANSCTAVGSYSIESKTRTLVDHWNGTAWSVQESPNPSTESSFNGVSCTSESACTAVGGSSGSMLAERWNGTKWSEQAAVDGKESTSDSLASVSCYSATACVAVGKYENSSHAKQMLAESWNGTEWTLKSTVNPKEVKESWLSGVSCVSGGTCLAVGSYETGSVQEALAEGWKTNGKEEWVLQTTPSTGGKANELLSVSCWSATSCTASGKYTTKEAPETTLTLGEHYT